MADSLLINHVFPPAQKIQDCLKFAQKRTQKKRTKKGLAVLLQLPTKLVLRKITKESFVLETLLLPREESTTAGCLGGTRCLCSYELPPAQSNAGGRPPWLRSCPLSTSLPSLVAIMSRVTFAIVASSLLLVVNGRLSFQLNQKGGGGKLIWLSLPDNLFFF